MHSTVKAPGSNYLCMYRELKSLNMQKSQLEQNVGVSHAKNLHTFAQMLSQAHMHAQSRYIDASQNAMLILFLCTLLHAHTQHLDSAQYPHIAVFILFLAQWGYTALLRAACRGHRDVVQMLLDCGSTLNEVDNVSVHPAPMSTDSV